MTVISKCQRQLEESSHAAEVQHNEELALEKLRVAHVVKCGHEWVAQVHEGPEQQEEVSALAQQPLPEFVERRVVERVVRAERPTRDNYAQLAAALH